MMHFHLPLATLLVLGCSCGAAAAAQRGACGRPFLEGKHVRSVDYVFSTEPPFDGLPAPADDFAVHVALMQGARPCFTAAGVFDAVACCAAATILNNQATYSACGVRPEKPSFFITHGFMSNSQEWPAQMGAAIRERIADANVFLVDWRQGAEYVLGQVYEQAASNTRVVAALLARAIVHHQLQVLFHFACKIQ